MTTTPKHLYPFIQHSVNVYCEPDITSGCVPAVPDLTVIHTRMFLECCFSAWLYQGFLSFPGGNRLDRMKSKSLQTWHTHGRPRLAHAASSTAQLPFYAPVAHLWFPPPLPLASTCLGPLCQMNSASSLTFDFRVTFPKSLTWSAAAAAKSLQSCPTPCDPIDGNHQAPPSLGFSRQEHWSGLPLPSHGSGLLNPNCTLIALPECLKQAGMWHPKGGMGHLCSEEWG